MLLWMSGNMLGSDVLSCTIGCLVFYLAWQAMPGVDELLREFQK